MQSKPNTGEFTRTKLPWIAAGVMMLIYLVTINHWVSIRSLPLIAKVTGWDWSLPTALPLFHLATYPFRFLPASILPLALNVFTVVCASLTIGLLVRSVAIFPQDRTEEQRIRQRDSSGLLNTTFAWAPAVLAAALLGFELTMWEHATAITNEALDLLVFAYLVRCVLEYRLSKNESWLTKLAFVYGLGVANNWALIGFFPMFLAGVLWVRGKSFFNFQFIIRMTALGLVGMLLYLLLPLLWQFKGEGQASFGEVLRTMLASQKAMIFNTPNLRARALILSLASVLPVVIMCVRFPNGFGEVHSTGASITNVIFRIIHILFAFACIAVAFNQKFSPRQLGLGLPFLTFYYLGALATGYLIGYLMIVHTDPPKRSYRIVHPLSKLFNPVVQAVAWAAVVIVPIALVYKNFKPAQSQNGKLLQNFAESLAAQIPPQPAILLADDPYQSALMEAWYARSGKNPHIVVTTGMLGSPAYHRDMLRRYGKRWPQGGGAENIKSVIDRTAVARALVSLAESNPVYYLHHSFGYFFEALQAESHGSIFQVKPYATNVIYPPRLTATQVSSNMAYWKSVEPIVRKAEEYSPFKAPDALFVATYFSRALDRWGVDLQRANDYSNAAPAFELALSVNTNNLPARVNLEYNQTRGTDRPRPSQKLQSTEELLGPYRSWDTLMGEGGPVDTPEYLFAVGQTFLQNSNFRQAADHLARVCELVPTNPTPRIALAAALISGQWTDEALKVVNETQKNTNTTPAQKLDLISMQAAIQFARHDTNRAEAILQKAIEEYPKERIFYESLNEMYRASGQWQKFQAILNRQISQMPTNAALRLARVEVAINAGDTNTAYADLRDLEKISPRSTDAAMFRIYLAIQEKDYKRGLVEVEKILADNEAYAPALVYKGILHMELKEDDKALEALNKSLKYDPNNITAVRNRAIVNLRLSNLNDAKKDYERLLPAMPRSHAVYYGLGEVAYKKKDRTDALNYFTEYLKYVPTNASPELEEERKKVEAMVNELKSK